jgi:hypothetical protein
MRSFSMEKKHAASAPSLQVPGCWETPSRVSNLILETRNGVKFRFVGIGSQCRGTLAEYFTKLNGFLDCSSSPSLPRISDSRAV